MLDSQHFRRSSMQRTVFLLAIGVLSVGPSTTLAQSASLADDSTGLKGYDIEIILDASGSMSGDMGGRQKIDVAKEAILKMLHEIPPTARLAFRAYGHKEVPEAVACKNSELLMPFDRPDPGVVKKALSHLKPVGLTPIEYSLREAWKDFPNYTEFGKMIILVSDGEETCGGNPCAAVREMRAAGVDVQVNIVGFDVNQTAEKQLRCIADATGGEYRKAANAADLTKGLKALARRAKMEYTTTAGEIKPGTGFETATLIQPGKYKYNILAEELHFYKVNVAKGQKLAVTAKFRSEKPRPGNNQGDMVLKLFGKYEQPFARKSVILNASSTEFRMAATEAVINKAAPTVTIQVARPAAAFGFEAKQWDKEPVTYELSVYLEDPENANE